MRWVEQCQAEPQIYADLRKSAAHV